MTAVSATSVKNLNLKFDPIITSPLKRTIQTEKIIAKPTDRSKSTTKYKKKEKASGQNKG